MPKSQLRYLCLQPEVIFPPLSSSPTMGKLSSEAEWWLGRVGLPRARGGKKQGKDLVVGVLAFEVAGLMSKVISLWHSLSDDRITRLRDETLHLAGVRKLVSDDDDFLLGLALTEITDSLASLARSVARLGQRCSDPVLQRFDLVFADFFFINKDADLYGLQYAGRKMERKVKKMERFVAASANLYQELEFLAELEPEPGPGPGLDFRNRVAWQRQEQEVRSLRESSPWCRTYDYIVRLLARSLFTIVGRIKHVFGFHSQKWDLGDLISRTRAPILPRSYSISVHPSEAHALFSSSAPGTRSGASGKCIPRSRNTLLPPTSKTKWPGGFGCMVGGNDGPVLQSCITVPRVLYATENNFPGTEAPTLSLTTNLSMYVFESSKSKLLNPPPSTLGAAALALHYANVIIVIEKFVRFPHLIGPDARDDLYNMLPTSIRAALRARLKSYAKNLALSVYDPVLAAEWSEAVARILEWLAPLAHNMIKWQSERNFEQQHLVSSTNVLLLQTLYFANQMKAEAAITELLVGLNYLWRFGKELNAKAILECVSSRNYDDCLSSKAADESLM